MPDNPSQRGHEARPPGRLNVVFLSNLFPIPTDPTRGIFNLQLARELRELCNLTVVCPLPWFPDWPILKSLRRWAAFGQVPYSYEVGGVPVLSPKYPMIPRVSGSIQGRMMELGIARTIRRLHLARPIDVIHALWLYPDAVAASRVAAQLGIPCVPAALGSDVNRMFGESDKQEQIYSMLRAAPRIVAVSDALAEKIVGVGVARKRLCVIPNGVNSDAFFVRDQGTARMQLGVSLDRPLILFVGRLSPEKGISTLLRSTAAALRSGNGFDLCLVGDGPLKAALNKEVEKLSIAEHVRFAGRVDHDQISLWMSACDVFCLPSLTEGCPNVINEALACGRPVVASSVGGIPDMVPDQCGLLVPAGNPELLQDALQKAICRKWDTTRISAAMTTKTWASTARRYLVCLEDAANPTHCKPAVQAPGS